MSKSTWGDDSRLKFIAFGLIAVLLIGALMIISDLWLRVLDWIV